MKMILIIFQKKIIWGKWDILGPKMAHPHNFGSAPRIFFKFRTMKGANRCMTISSVVFREKIHLGQFDLFSL